MSVWTANADLTHTWELESGLDMPCTRVCHVQEHYPRDISVEVGDGAWPVHSVGCNEARLCVSIVHKHRFYSQNATL